MPHHLILNSRNHDMMVPIVYIEERPMLRSNDCVVAEEQSAMILQCGLTKSSFGEEKDTVGDNVVSAQPLDSKDHAGLTRQPKSRRDTYNLCAPQVGSFEAINNSSTRDFLLFQSRGVSHQGNLLLSPLLRVVITARDASDRIASIVESTFPDEPPRCLWGKHHTEWEDYHPEPLEHVGHTPACTISSDTRPSPGLTPIAWKGQCCPDYARTEQDTETPTPAWVKQAELHAHMLTYEVKYGRKTCGQSSAASVKAAY